MDMPVLVSITQAKVRLEELIEGLGAAKRSSYAAAASPWHWLKPIYVRKARVHKASLDKKSSTTVLWLKNFRAKALFLLIRSTKCLPASGSYIVRTAFLPRCANPAKIASCE